MRIFTKHFFKGHAKAVIVQSLQVITIICVLMGQGFGHGVHDKFAPYLLSFLLSALAAVVPISFGGLGVREYIFKILSPVFHTDAHLAVFLSVSFYSISLLIALSGIYYVIRPKRLEQGLPSIGVNEDGNVENS